MNNIKLLGIEGIFGLHSKLSIHMGNIFIL
jgi:hypothetical protein